MKILKHAAILVLLAVIFSSCTKKKDNHDEPASFLGKWKLEKEEYRGWSTTIKTYSQYNIVYEFHSNGVLTVTGVMDDIHYGLYYGVYKPGEYLYSIVEDENIEHLFPYVKDKNGGYLKINDKIFFVCISSKEMMLYYTDFTDPPYFILKKIK